ncbi:MAG: hypothetical protein Q8S01_00030 [Ignavibacteria bacterium]|nr:hypothetical protein [Ignavibacteria bacterium]
MKILIKTLLLIMISLMLNSCSLFLGGIVALDNSANKGEKEISYDKVIKLREGKKIIVELNDSTKIEGTYKDYKEFREGNEQIKQITIVDKKNELETINTSEINKYIYVDEGGHVWTAAAIGGAVDALIIYGIIKGPKFGGGTGRIF